MASITVLQNDNPAGARVTLDDNRVIINTNFANVNTQLGQVATAVAGKAPAGTGTAGAVTKADVGLSNVDNTADANKPVSTAQAAAINAKYTKPGTGIPATDLDSAVQAILSNTVTTSTLNAAIDAKIAAINPLPVVSGENFSGTENVAGSGNVLTNDTTQFGSNFITQYRVFTLSSPGGVIYTAGVSSTTNPLGTFVMNANGSWSLTPRTNVYGTYNVDYWVSNGVSDPVIGRLVINLAFVVVAPTTAPDAGASVTNTSVTISPLANDVDPQGYPMAITQINGANVSVGQTVAVTNATVTLNANQSVTVMPSAGFTGTVSFPYTVSNGTLTSNNTVSVVISPTVGAGGTSNYITGTTTNIPYNFAANIPTKGQTKVEPTSGATVKRITDVTQDFPTQVALYQAYSRYPCENVSGEYVLAFGSNSTTCLVISRATNTITASLAYDNTGLATHTIGVYHEVRWHYTNAHPYRVYFVRGEQFWMIDDVRNQGATRTLVKDFSSVVDWAGTPSGMERKIYNDQEGNSSLDSDHWAWMAAYYDTGSGQWTVRAYIHYQVSTDTVHLMYPSTLTSFSRVPAGESARSTFRYRPNMVEMAPDASGIVIHHARAYAGNQDQYIGTIFEAPYLFPIDFNQATLTPFRISADATHAGWSTVAGAWYFVQQDNRRDKWCASPISGANRGYGNEGQIDVNAALGPGVIDFHTDGGIYPGMHFGVCTGAADGWTFVSTYSSSAVSANGMANHLYMMQIKPEAQTIKWMVGPSFNQYPAADKQDFNEAPASINLDGTRVYTCGDWNGTLGTYTSGAGVTAHYIDMFEVSLPTDWFNHFVPAAPTNTAVPTITGTATQNQTLTAFQGTWTGFPSPTYAFQWKRNGTNISGATNTTYLLQVADVGAAITVTVTGTNSAGSASATSAATAAVAGVPVPVNTGVPTVSGTATQGQTLTATTGTWSNTPNSYAYQWYRGVSAISGATSSTYTLQGADVGSAMHVTVLASNSYGPAIAAVSSANTATVTSNSSLVRAAAATSTDPSPGSNVTSRAASSFTATAGMLLCVSVRWNTNGGTNTGVSVADNLGNTYTAGTVTVFADGNYNRVQQFWVLSSAAGTCTVTATNAASSTPLDVSVVGYTASTGTAWTMTSQVTLGSGYIPMPITSPAFNMQTNSVAVGFFGDAYGTSGSVVLDAGDSLAHNVANNNWVVERFTTDAALAGTTMSSSYSNDSYSRVGISLTVFRRA